MAERLNGGEKLAELRGPNFVPDHQFRDLRMLEVPWVSPNRGEMLVGYVFDSVPEQFAEGMISDRMPISGPIFFEISTNGHNKYGARCAGCDESSSYYERHSDKNKIFRWAREHRCKRRLELNNALR